MKWLHYLFIVSLLLFSCKGQNVKNKRPTRLLTDALQREVALPANKTDPGFDGIGGLFQHPGNFIFYL